MAGIRRNILMKANLIQGVRELTMACLRIWRHAVSLTLIAGFTALAIGPRELDFGALSAT